jgi:hypothetical protein
LHRNWPRCVYHEMRRFFSLFFWLHRASLAIPRVLPAASSQRPAASSQRFIKWLVSFKIQVQLMSKHVIISCAIGYRLIFSVWLAFILMLIEVKKCRIGFSWNFWNWCFCFRYSCACSIICWLWFLIMFNTSGLSWSIVLLMSRLLICGQSSLGKGPFVAWGRFMSLVPFLALFGVVVNFVLSSTH